MVKSNNCECSVFSNMFVCKKLASYFLVHNFPLSAYSNIKLIKVEK